MLIYHLHSLNKNCNVVFDKDNVMWFLCISRKRISSEISAKNGFDIVMAISSL